jgi:hypothetical protein
MNEGVLFANTAYGKIQQNRSVGLGLSKHPARRLPKLPKHTLRQAQVDTRFSNKSLVVKIRCRELCTRQKEIFAPTSWTKTDFKNLC